MRPESLGWVLLGGGASFLVAALISVALNGPGWPYFMALGVLSLAAALAVSCRIVGFGARAIPTRDAGEPVGSTRKRGR